MKGGSSDTFEWLSIPGVITPATGSQEWYDEQIAKFGYTHVKPILYNLPEGENRQYEEHMFEGKMQLVSSFWKVRKNLHSLLGMLLKDAYTFYSQYMGMPIGKGKAAMSMDMIKTYEKLEEFQIRYTFLTADTASTKETYSDPSVACFWGVTKCKKLVLIDSVIGKWEVPELIERMREYWKEKSVFDPNRPSMKAKCFYIEDKSSGLFLNQQYLKDGTVNVKPVPRDGTANNDKFSRFLNTVPYFKVGDIVMPRGHENHDYMVLELLGQSERGSATGHDDVADNFSDAVAAAFAGQQMSYESWS
jgi:predicted phage terminase large subunit-like protein